MHPLVELLFKVLTAGGVVAAIYNIFSSRTIAQEQGQKAKVEEALALGKKNEADIKHLREHVDLKDTATKERLDQIGKDVSWVRDILTKWLLTPNRNP